MARQQKAARQSGFKIWLRLGCMCFASRKALVRGSRRRNGRAFPRQLGFHLHISSVTIIIMVPTLETTGSGDCRRPEAEPTTCPGLALLLCTLHSSTLLCSMYVLHMPQLHSGRIRVTAVRTSIEAYCVLWYYGRCSFQPYRLSQSACVLTN